jgi:hypothetical protein
MAWRVEKHDMVAGQAHGRDLQQSLGWGSGVWMGGEGGERVCRERPFSGAREMCNRVFR